MARLLEWLRTVVIAICLTYAIRLLLVQAYHSGDDVEHLIYDVVGGDRYMVLKIASIVQTPLRGELVITDSPESNYEIISRVIGLPGERLDIIDGEVRVNGAALKEDYLLSQLPYNYTVQIPAGEYFLMADSRADGATLGATSISWGTVPARQIEGKAWVRFWPPSRIGFFKRPQY
jgi:signal peptidase I